MSAQLPGLGDQYVDSFKVLTRRLYRLETMLKDTGASGASLRPKLAMLQGIRFRIEQLGPDVQLQVPLSASQLLPSWYLVGETCADKAGEWRLAIAIERLGRALLIPVRILHETPLSEIVECSRVTEQTIESGKEWLVKISKCIPSCDDPVRGMLFQELLARLTKISIIRDPMASLRISVAELPDHMEINALEDVVEPDILFAECQELCQDNQGRVIYLMKP